MANQLPRTFISFDYDNNHNHKVLFVGQSKNSKTPFNIADWSSKQELPQTEWERLISSKIAMCDIMVVLVGKSSAGAIGVIKEINMALAHNVPFFGVYVDDAHSGTALPIGLQRNRVVEWAWDTISNAIEQVSKEGKNRR